MERLCYVSRNYASLRGAGSKAKTDNERTLQELGARNVGLRQTHYDNMVLTFLLNLAGVVKTTITLRRGDTLVLQYPVKKYYTFLCRAAHWHGARVVTIIHDLTSMHRHRISTEKEIQRLQCSDHIIASNEAMERWLKSHGLTRPTTPLGLFDYRSQAGGAVSHRTTAVPHHTTTEPPHPSTPPSLVYAGAITPRKNAFLTKLDGSLTLHVYGNCDSLPGLREARGIVCHPFMDAEEFISSGEGTFGLVWDGDATDTCQGDFGEYLRWNSPHKVSFYLRAGKPIVIWREAAVAPLLEQEGAAVCIESLDELPARLAALTPEALESLKSNARRLSQKLNEGYFLRKAIENCG